MKKIAAYFMLFGIIFWVAETWYFGWNVKPESRAEVICDMLVVSTILGSVACSWLGDGKRSRS